MVTYKNQSTAIISPMSSNGRLTACSTMMVVMEPADGIPAAPIAIAVAVTLKINLKQQSIEKFIQMSLQVHRGLDISHLALGHQLTLLPKFRIKFPVNSSQSDRAL